MFNNFCYKILNIDPHHFDSLALLANIAAINKNYTKAKNFLHKANEIQPNIPFTQQAKQVLSNAWDEARKLGHNYVNVEHLFLSIFRVSIK